MTSPTGRRAFTLVEMIIVMAMMAMLAGLLLAVLGVIRVSARKTQAQKEVKEIYDALKSYYVDYHGYPPDTDDWGAKGGYDETSQVFPATKDVDVGAIHRYLGTDRTINNRLYTAQMALKDERLTDFLADPDELAVEEAGVYVDPWGTPFQVDCVHMYFDATAKRFRQKGWPFRKRGTTAEPTEDDKTSFDVDAKVVSYGPDGQSTGYPFDSHELPVDDAGKVADDLRSW